MTSGDCMTIAGLTAVPCINMATSDGSEGSQQGGGASAGGGDDLTGLAAGILRALGGAGDETEEIQGAKQAAAAEEAGGGAINASRDLGMDPATGKFRQGEYETAIRIQQERGVMLQRSADPGVDWVDTEHNTYDAVGNFSSKYFDKEWPNLQTRILDHMAKADFVPVDVAGFTEAQIAKCSSSSIRWDHPSSWWGSNVRNDLFFADDPLVISVLAVRLGAGCPARSRRRTETP